MYAKAFYATEARFWAFPLVNIIDWARCRLDNVSSADTTLAESPSKPRQEAGKRSCRGALCAATEADEKNLEARFAGALGTNGAIGLEELLYPALGGAEIRSHEDLAHETAARG